MPQRFDFGPFPKSECSLDSILTPDSLNWAWLRVKNNKGAAGADGITIKRFGRALDANLVGLADDVSGGRYNPGPVRFVMVQEPGKFRRLAILTIRDRILQRAVLDRLGPLLEPAFLPSSFGYRPGLSVQDAVERIVYLRDRGLTNVVDADIRGCFDNLDHQLLIEFLQKQIPELDQDVLALIQQWIKMPERNRRHRKPQPRTKGILQGAPISPLLCNLYLHQMDASLKRRRLLLVRYADDFVILCRSPQHADHAFRILQKILGGIRLSLHPGKSQLTDFDQGFDFLGVHFEGDTYSYIIDDRRIVVETFPPDWFYYHADGYD